MIRFANIFGIIRVLGGDLTLFLFALLKPSLKGCWTFGRLLAKQKPLDADIFTKRPAFVQFSDNKIFTRSSNLLIACAA